ncbi:MAG: hypothetical protein IIY45_02365 [Firmicutes bacterium]|nr:hypothetical protein [Bacillota bacterium]
MKIEVLYPEIANLFGDHFQMNFLAQSMPDAVFYRTSLHEMPRFMTEDVNMIYMGPTTEDGLEMIIEKLMPCKERLKELIEKDVVMLMTGNAFEVFGRQIEIAEGIPGGPSSVKEEGRVIECLGLFDYHSVRRMMHRYNTLFLGSYETEEKKLIDVVGFKAEFSYTYGDNSEHYCFKGERGFGIHPDTMLEGFRYHNFFGTYLNGPLLINNPLFAKDLLKKAGAGDVKLAFEKQAMDAYEAKLKQFKDPKIEYVEE